LLRPDITTNEIERISVLLVMAPDSPGFEGLLSCLEMSNADLVVVSDCRGVRRQLRVARPSVIVTGVTLSDGNWCGVLSQVVQSETSASVVVYSQETDDRLRSEVVSRGAYDLLSGPVRAGQLRRCIEEAHYFRKEAMPQPAYSQGADRKPHLV
jgi:DNA-binding NtrC family response regulator